MLQNRFFNPFKIRQLIHYVIALDLVWAGSLLTVLGVVGGALGYLFQIMVGRNVGPVGYAEFNFVASLSLVIASPFVAISLLSSRTLRFSNI